MISIIISGCARESLPCGDAGVSLKSGISEDEGILKLTGAVSFRNATDGVKEIVLNVTNNTKNGLWVPGSDGDRGQIDCESVNLSEIDQEDFLHKSFHSDHGMCQFPGHYIRLKSGQSSTYVYKIPNNFSGNIEISVWAPWRTEDGKRIDMETKKSALKDGDLLIERVEGVGLLK